MLRYCAALGGALIVLTACGSSGFALRAVPQIVADNVGQPVSRLRETFGEPRKVEAMPTHVLYVWFLPQMPPGAPPGYHGCEMEVTVDARSQRVLGYSLSNIGWSKCGEIERRIRVTAS
jgi:hypothetical protein